MKYSTIITWSLISAFLLWLIPNIGISEITVEGSCIDKYITSDHFNDSYYHVVYKLADGNIKVEHPDNRGYYHSEIGHNYTWLDWAFYWKPSLKNK